MRLIVRIALTLLLLSSMAAYGQTPQDPYEGRTLERVEVEGNTSVAMDTIRVYLGLEPGEPYSAEILEQNFPLLWQTGLFDDIRVEAVEGDQGGVVVRVIVVERPRITAVEYRGAKSITTAQIVERLQAQKIDLHIGTTVEQILIKRAAEVIEDLYAEGGFEGVSIEPRLEDTSFPGEKRVVFEINEGIKAKVAAINFEGNRRFSNRKLRRAMKEVKKHNLITWIRKKNVYTPSKLGEDLERVKNLYQDYGYLDITFGDPIVETIGTRKPRVKITVPVHEGEVYRFNSVSVEGNTIFTGDQIIGNWPLKKGDILSRRAIQNRVDLFDELYRRRGYIYAFLDVEYPRIDGSVSDVKIKIFEGDQFRLGRMEFEGNTVTKDKVIRREIFLAEGDVMDMETFRASLFKVGQLGYFKLVENPEFNVDPEERTVDVLIKGKEEGKNDIQFGGGYSQAYGFFAQFQFSTRNFLGEGETFGISFQQGANQDFFSLSYGDPWFLDRPHSFGVSIFNRKSSLPAAVGFDSTSKGGSLAYGFRTGRFQSLTFQYSFQDTDEETRFQPLPDREGNVPLPAISNSEFRTSALIPSFRYDSRDNPFDTTRGLRTNLAVSYTGGPLGGTVEFIKPVLTLSYFRPVSRRSTVSFNLEGGEIYPQGDDCANLFSDLSEFDNRLCVPRSERFFVGGEQSVRGFRSFSIGPREVVNGSEVVVGGYKYSVMNLEYIFKVNDPLRLVLFADGGQAWAYKEPFDFGDLRYSAGAELRIFLPVFQFPLRFIYAQNLDEQEGDRFESFQFSIGNTF